MRCAFATCKLSKPVCRSISKRASKAPDARLFAAGKMVPSEAPLGSSSFLLCFYASPVIWAISPSVTLMMRVRWLV